MHDELRFGPVRLASSILFGLAALAWQPASADESAPTGREALCINTAVNIPAPAGEGDLKGNALLKEYCSCFAKAFEARAARRQAQAEVKPPARQSIQEEREMRTACRAKFDLPALQFRPLPK